MGTALAKTTLEDFLRWENGQPDKHEFHRGEIFAMVGGRRVHGVVVANLSRPLGNALHGSRCREYALVDPDSRRSEVFRIGADRLRVLHDMSDRPALELASVGIAVPMADVFDGVEPP